MTSAWCACFFGDSFGCFSCFESEAWEVPARGSPLPVRRPHGPSCCTKRKLVLSRVAFRGSSDDGMRHGFTASHTDSQVLFPDIDLLESYASRDRACASTVPSLAPSGAALMARRVLGRDAARRHRDSGRGPSPVLVGARHGDATRQCRSASAVDPHQRSAGPHRDAQHLRRRATAQLGCVGLSITSGTR